MSDLNLTPLLRSKLAPYPRTIGRYNSSEMFGIAKGYVKPEKWLQGTTFNVEALMAMWNGMVVHDFVQQLLPEEGNEVKLVHTHNISPTETIQLVAKVDHLPAHVNEVWEFKSSKNLYKDAKAAHLYQAQLYCTVHQRPIAKVFQPVQNEYGLYLKHIGTVERDDVWFAAQMDILAEFHKKIIALQEAAGESLTEPDITI